MSCRKTVFPFTAIVGQEKMKKALILNAINPNLGGVLIRGEKGTAKSTIARALADLLPEIEVVRDCPFNCDPNDIRMLCVNCRKKLEKGEKLKVIKRKMKVVDLPLGATEDRVVGTLDIERAIKKGEKHFAPGLLAEVNRGILYVDEVNLLDDHLVDILLDAAAMGVNIVEREGVSYSHPAKFILVGTMNPEEGELRPQLLDRFGLCVEVHGLSDPEERMEVVKRCIEYEKEPHKFEKEWERAQKNLQEIILKAQKVFPYVTYSEEMLKLVTQIAIDMGVDGHRADIAMIKTARTIAAYHQRKKVTEEDIKEAAELVLPHRMRRKPFEKPQVEPEKIEEVIKKHREKKQKTESRRQNVVTERQRTEEKEQEESKEEDGAKDLKFEAGEPFTVKKITLPRDKVERKGNGRRSKTKTDSKAGRYVRSKIPQGKTDDIAFDATLRAAAPYQNERNRKKNNRGVVIETQDIRRKVRKKKIGNTILFVVDSSGSMGMRKKMKEVKTAILSLLVDAYQKRDSVGLVAFKGNQAIVLLSPTSSVELAKKCLEELPTGGRTPLSQGLLKGFEVLKKELRKNSKINPLLVLLTDGKANVSISQNNALEEAKKVAEEIKKTEIKSIVIDTESGLINFGKTEEIATSLGAIYYKIKDLKADNILQAIKNNSLNNKF